MPRLKNNGTATSVAIPEFRFLHWVLRAGHHGLAQGLAQGAALLTGIMVVRSLDKTDYAHYAIIVALLPAIANVADSGVGAVLLSRGQSIRTEPTALSALFRNALVQRRWLAAPIVLIGLAWVWVLLNRAGAEHVPFLLAALLLILIPTLNVGLLQVIHRVRLDTATLRRATLFAAVARLVLTGGLHVTQWLTIWNLLFITLITTMANAVYLHRRAGLVRTSRMAAKDSTQEFRSAIAKVLPMTVSAVLTSQALIGILTLKGSVDVVAEFTAVSRFGLVFSLFLPIIADLVAPTIARLPDRRSVLMRSVTAAYAVCLGIIAGALLLVYLASDILLALLGAGYEGLQLPLILVFLGYGITFLGYSMSTVAQSRGWLSGSWIYVPLAGVWLVAAIMMPEVSSTKEGAWLFVAQSSLLVLTQAFRTALGLWRTPAALNYPR